jgi:deazaflavin-dependent oxidoreductase (nitroreductase family)
MAQREMPAGQKFFMRSPLLKVMQNTNVWVYRKTGGKLGARMKGAPILLLTTRGRKTGKQRTTPLIYLSDGADLVIVASKGGTPQHPLWYRNLQAEARVRVQVGSEERPKHARTADATERARLWPLLVQLFPDYGNYQSWSDREIPVVILSPTA